MTDSNNQLTILGDDSDKVTLLNSLDEEWSLTDTIDGFNIYEHAGDPTVTVRIAELIDDTIID